MYVCVCVSVSVCVMCLLLCLVFGDFILLLFILSVSADG